ncbi:DUF4178 domain-containing protein [Tomitella fengzijianii]|uniref:DUF4178 domain-containing protein n=1 Tax=Tomitella fengzijianii TaxID=2597660 RepID=A0A516X2M9_9ACTN|nr:DUF4178 domain-containing protein [Tomitella fengzijianii]QDQ97334.1 DUF4178 domain-containing protein [Tomitella fengzijianii]
MSSFLILIAIILIIAAGVIAYLGFRAKRQAEAAQRPPSQRTDPLGSATSPTSTFGPRSLGPGAIVSYFGVDYVVRGTLTLREGPFVWWEHLLASEGEPKWLSVEEDDGTLEMALWHKRPGPSTAPQGTVQMEGIDYTEDERGRASYTTEGNTGLPSGGEMDYVDFVSADGNSLLGFERWAPGQVWEVSVGRTLLPGELTVYPAPPAGS